MIVNGVTCDTSTLVVNETVIFKEMHNEAFMNEMVQCLTATEKKGCKEQKL